MHLCASWTGRNKKRALALPCRKWEVGGTIHASNNVVNPPHAFQTAILYVCKHTLGNLDTKEPSLLFRNLIATFMHMVFFIVRLWRIGPLTTPLCTSPKQPSPSGSSSVSRMLVLGSSQSSALGASTGSQREPRLLRR